MCVCGAYGVRLCVTLRACACGLCDFKSHTKKKSRTKSHIWCETLCDALRVTQKKKLHKVSVWCIWCETLCDFKGHTKKKCHTKSHIWCETLCDALRVTPKKKSYTKSLCGAHGVRLCVTV